MTNMQPHELLEQRFGEWIGNPNVAVCSSGTASLQLALQSLDLPAGGQVLVPEFTMIACPRAVVLAGLRPVFVDCREDLLIDPDQLDDATTSQTVAVMPVHIYGRQCSIGRIIDFAQQNKLAVIEDMAEIHGVRPHPQSDAACWSFYRNKIIAGEEGGAVAFRNNAWRGDSACVQRIEKMKSLRSHGFTSRHDFYHIPGGMNYRLSNSHARLILISLENVDRNLAARRRVEQWYNERVPHEFMMPPRDAPWVYDLRLPGRDASGLVGKLQQCGVAARHAFRPCSEQAEFIGHYRHLTAYRMSREVLYLPINPEMTQRDVDQICNLLPTE